VSAVANVSFTPSIYIVYNVGRAFYMIAVRCSYDAAIFHCLRSERGVCSKRLSARLGASTVFLEV